MSAGNVELIQSVYAAFNRGDVDAAFESFDPEFECDMSRAIGVNVERDVYDLAQFRRLLADYAASWDSFELGIDELDDAGEQVVLTFTNKARGRGGIELAGRGTFVWTIREGAILRACLYQERAEALGAAGLSE